MSSTEVAEYLVPKVLERPAVEQDMGDSLSSLPALAAGAGNLWHSLGGVESSVGFKHVSKYKRVMLSLSLGR